MLKCILNVPMPLDHDVTSRGMAGQMEKPKGPSRLCWPNEKRRVVCCSGCHAGVIPQQPLNERASAFPVPKSDKVSYLRFGQLQRRDRLRDLRGLRQMVDESVRGESQNDFRGREFGENAGDQRQLYLGKPGLIEKEDGSSRTRLPSENRLKNAFDLVLEQTRSDDDSVFVDLLSALRENFSEMVGMSCFLIDEIEFAVDMQRLDTFLVQPLGCRRSFFQHDKRRAG